MFISDMCLTREVFTCKHFLNGKMACFHKTDKSHMNISTFMVIQYHIISTSLVRQSLTLLQGNYNLTKFN